jgi:hypothetical protein
VCGPLQPIGDDAGPGEVELGKPWNLPGLRCTAVAGGGGGEGHRFSYLLGSHMTYLAGSHILRSWPGIRLKRSRDREGSSRTAWCANYWGGGGVPGLGVVVEGVKKVK